MSKKQTRRAVPIHRAMRRLFLPAARRAWHRFSEDGGTATPPPPPWWPGMRPGVTAGHPPCHRSDQKRTRFLRPRATVLLSLLIIATGCTRSRRLDVTGDDQQSMQQSLVADLLCRGAEEAQFREFNDGIFTGMYQRDFERTEFLLDVSDCRFALVGNIQSLNWTLRAARTAAAHIEVEGTLRIGSGDIVCRGQLHVSRVISVKVWEAKTKHWKRLVLEMPGPLPPHMLVP